jgi:hypothetical protein
MKFYFHQRSYPAKEECAMTLRECILEDIEKTKCELEIAYAGFDNVTDPDLIDCYIYELNSIMKRYRYLLNQAAKLSPLPEGEADLSNAETTIGALVS